MGGGWGRVADQRLFAGPPGPRVEGKSGETSHRNGGLTYQGGGIIRPLTTGLASTRQMRRMQSNPINPPVAAATWLAVSVLAIGSAAPGQAGPNAEAKAILAKREQHKREVRDPLRQKVAQRRQALSQEADLKNLHFLIARAQKAYDAVMATDREIVAAREAQQAAEKALAGTVKAQLAGNPQLQAIEGEIEAARAADKQLNAQESQLEKALGKVRELLTTSPEVQQARQAYESAQKAYYDLPNRHPKFIAARKAVTAAQKALDERIRNLPERKALDQARKTYTDLRHSSPEIQQARQARDEVRQAYEEAIDQAVRTSQSGAAIHRQLEEVRQKRAEAQAMREGFGEDLYKIRRSIEKSNAVIAQARRAYEQAHAKCAKVSVERAADEQKALANARRELAERVRRKMTMDPILLDLMDRLKKAEKVCKDLMAQYGQAQRKGRAGTGG